MRILVTGATGNVGRLVTQELARRGVAVRALTRTPEKAGFGGDIEVVGGDLERTGSLRGALEGVERLYLFPQPDTARDVVALAEEAGVRRIVTLSSAAVADGFDTTHHLPVERAVEASGLEWTHVRPGEFMANKLSLWGPSIRAERRVRDPFPDDAWCPVHEGDIADVAVAALLEEGHTGRAHTLHGPEMISPRSQVAAIAAALGEEVAVETVTREEAREIYVSQGGFSAAAADMLLGFTDYEGNPVAEGEDPWAGAYNEEAELSSLRDALGRPGRTFAAWARDHVDDFR
ncbi:SDR family oxidoreductase [Streptomyces sp. NPDC057638]|uniref:SDR family oxidoreductase n=1 Tax=Streptomyces sp. NPDC057638 TaxID=3346190 RepID=UPI0036AEBB87